MAKLAKKQVSCPRWGQQHLGPPSHFVGKRKFKDHRGKHVEDLSRHIQASRGYSMLPPGVLESHATNVVQAETHPASGGTGGGGGREWAGPTWQFTSFDHPMEAMLNLLGNAHLMTPIRVVRKRKDGSRPPRFIPDPDYSGSGESPPQPDAMHCPLNNVIPMNELKNEYIRRTYESNRDRALRSGKEVTEGSAPTWFQKGTQSRKKKVYQQLRAVETEQPSPPLLVPEVPPSKVIDGRVMVDNCNDITRWGAVNDDALDISAFEMIEGTRHGDTWSSERDNLECLSTNMSLALYMNGVFYLSPYTMIDLSPNGTVNVHHKLDNGALYTIRLPEVELYALIESGISSLEPSDMLDENTLSVQAVEYLLQLPTELDKETNQFLGYTIGELTHHWAMWDYESRHSDDCVDDHLEAMYQNMAAAGKAPVGSSEVNIVRSKRRPQAAAPAVSTCAGQRMLNRYWRQLLNKADMPDDAVVVYQDDSAAYVNWLHDHSFDDAYHERVDRSKEFMYEARKHALFDGFPPMEVSHSLLERLTAWDKSPVLGLFKKPEQKPTIEGYCARKGIDLEQWRDDREIERQRVSLATRVLYQRVKAERDIADDAYHDDELREVVRQLLKLPEHRLARLKTDELAALVASAGDGKLLTREGDGLYRINFNKEIMPREGVEQQELWVPPGCK